MESKSSIVAVALKDGLSIFIRNLHLVIPVLAIMVLSYFLLVFTVFAILPAEKIEEIVMKYGGDLTNSEKAGEEIIKEFSGYLTKDLKRTISIFVLFGLAMFVLQEFNTAGMASSALELSKGSAIGAISIRKFLENGFIYTLRMVQVDIIAILIAVAVSSPFILIFYFSQNLAFQMVLSFVLTLVILITTFARFYALQDMGIFDSFANGIRFFLQNILGVVLLFFTWFIISFPLIALSFLFPPLIFLWPALLLLFYILLARFFVLVTQKSSNPEGEWR